MAVLRLSSLLDNARIIIIQSTKNFLIYQQEKSRRHNVDTYIEDNFKDTFSGALFFAFYIQVNFLLCLLHWRKIDHRTSLSHRQLIKILMVSTWSLLVNRFMWIWKLPSSIKHTRKFVVKTLISRVFFSLLQVHFNNLFTTQLQFFPASNRI